MLIEDSVVPELRLSNSPVLSIMVSFAMAVVALAILMVAQERRKRKSCHPSSFVRKVKASPATILCLSPAASH